MIKRLKQVKSGIHRVLRSCGHMNLYCSLTSVDNIDLHFVFNFVRSFCRHLILSPFMEIHGRKSEGMLP